MGNIITRSESRLCTKKSVLHYINIWRIGCCGELKLTRAHGGLIRKDVGMCQKEQCTQLTRWLPLESEAWAEISCLFVFGFVLLKFWVWVIRDHSWDHSWILPLEIQKRSKKLRSGFHFPYWLKLRLRPQCNCRPIGVICCPLPSDQGFNNIRDHSYSEFPCCFLIGVFF